MPDLLQGALTFLFTDIEGSTPLWEQQPEEMATALRRHDEMLRSCVARNNGQVIKTTGDGLHAVFGRAGDGLACALDAQRALASEAWPADIGALRVRMALHTGEAEFRENDYYGPAVNRAARIEAAAHGGQVLLSETTRDLVQDDLPQGTGLIDLGRYQLKGFARPERIFQLVAPGLPSVERPLRTAMSRRHNLPDQSTPFVGRERELIEIRRLLERGRLLTIVGPGGIGKTRLAIQAATNSLDDFANGVYFVPLAHLESPGQVVQAIAEAIGFPLATGEPPIDQLLRHLRNRQYMLILDNFEHLLEGASIVSQILKTAGQVTILVTSQERLRLQEESLLPVEGLNYPDSGQVTNALEYDAVQLFMNGARRVEPSLPDHPEVMADVVHICRLVQGMPLAILLSAAWVDMLSPAEIAAEVARSLDLLQGEWRDTPGRHRSVRAAFEPAWERLSAEQRDLFIRLSIFQGGFTREAAGQIANASLRGVAGLVAKSLLRRDPETGRYHVDQLLRHFAMEKATISPGIGDKMAEAHGIYFADFMEGCRARLMDARQQAALTEVEADLDNVRAAWRYWLDRGDAVRIDQFLDAFWRLYEIRGWINAAVNLYQEAADVLRPVAGKASGKRQESTYARALTHLANFLAHLGNAENGLNQAKESVAILRRQERWSDLSLALHALSWNATYVRDQATFMAISQEAELATSRHDDVWLRAYALCWQGRRETMLQNHTRGRSLIEESLHLFESLGDNFATGWPGIELGNTAVLSGDFGHARERYLKVYVEGRERKYDWVVGKAARYLGDLALLIGDLEEAGAYLLHGLQISDELGLIRDVVNVLYDIATLKARTGDPAEAVRLLAFIHHHPLSDQTRSFSFWEGDSVVRIRDLATRQLAELQDKLSPDAFRAAMARGHEGQLDKIVLRMLESGGGSSPAGR